ncbi:MAG: hypothetical protein ACRCTE_05685 [Cellulosilyticaceae bacterium]
MLVGCSNRQDVTLPYGTYTLEASQDIVKPTIELREDGGFIFVFSSLSSYIGYGTYEIEENQLKLETDDQKYTYLFDIVDETLAFDANSSSEITDLATIFDGAIFK